MHRLMPFIERCTNWQNNIISCLCLGTCIVMTQIMQDNNKQ